jgi:hypothetical protein
MQGNDQIHTMPEVAPLRLKDASAGHIHIWSRSELLFGYSDQLMQVTPFRNVAFLVDQIVVALNEFFGFGSLRNVSYYNFGTCFSCPFAELQVDA